MDLIELLVQEHRQIERVIRVLQRETKALRAGASLNRPLFEAIVEFLRAYADGVHQDKEERVLFELLHDHGLSRDAGATHDLLAEHDLCRALTDRMSQALRAQASHDDGWREQLIEAASSYMDLLISQIRQEDAVFFPMAKRLLSQAVRSEVQLKFSATSRAQLAEFTAAAAAIEALCTTTPHATA